MFAIIAIVVAAGFAQAEWSALMENDGLHEGDMILSVDQQKVVKNGNSYAAMIGQNWPDNTVVYQIERSLAKNIDKGSQGTQVVRQAMSEFQSKTSNCIKFKQRTNERAYISIFKGAGCYSQVGYTGGSYKLSLAQGCWRTGIVMHELMHAIGFFHEQSRTDRDQFVEVVWNHIQPNMKSNFNIARNTDSLGSPYDYRSIMHYGKTAFGNGQVTMRTKQAEFQNVIGGAQTFSAQDVIQIRKKYRCSGGGPDPRTERPIVTSGPGPRTPYPGTCTDISDVGSCRNWKAAGQCKTHIAQYCKRTCNIC